MHAGIIVFIRNLVIAASGFFFVSRGIKHLDEGGAAFLILVMIIINAQNALYEGLFLTHTMSYKDKIAKSIFLRQIKITYVIPALSLVCTSVYSYFVLNNTYSFTLYILLYMCFLVNVFSVGTVNLFCTSKKHIIYFLIDIISTLFTLLLVFFSLGIKSLVIALLLRVCGSAISTFILQCQNYKKIKNEYNDLPLYSLGYFSGTILSLIRDSLSPLLIGWLVGPSTLVAIRIFNTCYSAPGLIAGAMNKIIVRYAQKESTPNKIFRHYTFVLYFMTFLYLVMWYVGGDKLYAILFGTNKYFSIPDFTLALTLFCVFWPLGQTSIAKMIYLGTPRLFFKTSVVWTCVSLICLVFLINYNLTVYIYILALSQSLNIFVLYKVLKYEKEST